MTDKNKPMSFDQWKGPRFVSDENEEYARSAWDHARIGYIPADRAILVPDEQFWPSWADGIRVIFNSNEPWMDGECGERSAGRMQTIKYIPRPVPAWTPKVGDAVFTHSVLDKETFIGRVIGMEDEMFKVVFSEGDTGTYDHFNLKPFDPAKIGLPFSEI